MTEKEFESRLTHSFNVGIRSGINQASDFFKLSKDSEAMLCRDLSEKLKQLAKEISIDNPS